MRQKIVTYPGPDGMTPFPGVSVEVDNTPLFVYPVVVNTTHGQVNQTTHTPMAYFDLADGPVTVRVKVPFDINSVTARPLRLEIQPSLVDLRTLEFSLSGPEKVSLEFNGRRGGEIHLFANPIEMDIPDIDDPSVLYFAPGIHHAGRIELRAGQTIYIAGGAVVYGWIEGIEASNATVRGRGILDGHDEYAHLSPQNQLRCLTPEEVNNRIRLRGCHHVTVRDIFITDSANWTFKSISCHNLNFENLKLFGGRNNTDGFDLCGCQQVHIRDCFTRVWDDSVVLKSFSDGNVEDILVEHCQFWNDYAQTMEIGFELACDHVRNITFRDIDVLHNYWGGVLTIHNGNQAVVENVLYENIRIEDCHAWIIEQWIGPSHWLVGDVRGNIRNVTVRNVSVVGHYDRTRMVRLHGHDADHSVGSMSIKSMFVGNQTIASLDDLQHECNAHSARPVFGRAAKPKSL